MTTVVRWTRSYYFTGQPYSQTHEREFDEEPEAREFLGSLWNAADDLHLGGAAIVEGAGG